MRDARPSRRHGGESLCIDRAYVCRRCSARTLGLAQVEMAMQAAPSRSQGLLVVQTTDGHLDRPRRSLFWRFDPPRRHTPWVISVRDVSGKNNSREVSVLALFPREQCSIRLKPTLSHTVPLQDDSALLTVVTRTARPTVEKLTGRCRVLFV